MTYTKLLGSVALATLLATSFTGCDSDDDTDTTDLETKITTTEQALADAEAKATTAESALADAETKATTAETALADAENILASVSSEQVVIAELKIASNKAISASLVGVEDNDKIPFAGGSFSPYERVAVFPTVKKADGTIDYEATYAKVSELANTFAKHVANVDEPTSDSETFKATNWILAGYESTETATDENVKHHMLGIPTKHPINPTLPISPANTKKVKVVEICNSGYAGKALGVTNVGGENGAKVAEGVYHSTALPCEVTIYNDDKAIYVDMLNPETIFTLFFTEVFTSAEMANTDFRAEMMALPTQVKKEITAMVYSAFEAETFTKTSIKMGTIFSSMSKALGTTDTASGGNEPYRHYSYTSDDATEFTSTDAKHIAEKIIAVMTKDTDTNVGVQESALKALLPSDIAGVTPSWRSGRLEPLKVPGGSWIVEACSPTYAKEALTTGEYHTGALPCEISVMVNPDDNKTIDVSFLNPEFMFGAMFEDSLSGMDADATTAFNTIINNINGDLKQIVDYAMEYNVTGFDGSNTQITPINY